MYFDQLCNVFIQLLCSMGCSTRPNLLDAQHFSPALADPPISYAVRQSFVFTTLSMSQPSPKTIGEEEGECIFLRTREQRLWHT